MRSPWRLAIVAALILTCYMLQSTERLAIASTSNGHAHLTVANRYILFLTGICPASESYWTGWASLCARQIDAAKGAQDTFSLLIQQLKQAKAVYTPEYFSYSDSDPSHYTAIETHYIGNAVVSLRHKIQ